MSDQGVLMRLHWWCMAQASKYDRPGYSRRAATFDWIGGRAAGLHRWLRKRPTPMKDYRVRGSITADEQLRRWAEGDPVCPNDRGECAPDFSCCRRHLMWPEDKRRAYVQADPRTREKMMMGALGALAADEGVKAHVTRGVPGDHES